MIDPIDLDRSLKHPAGGSPGLKFAFPVKFAYFSPPIPG
jgi:hypothetical protein